MKKISFVALFSVLILSIDSIVEFTLGFRIFGSSSPGFEYGRLSSFFGSELIMGSFIVKMLPFVFILLHYYFDIVEKKLLYPLIFLILIITYFGVYLSGERSAMFNGIMLIIFFLF